MTLGNHNFIVLRDLCLFARIASVFQLFPPAAGGPCPALVGRWWALWALCGALCVPRGSWACPWGLLGLVGAALVS